MIPKIVLQYTEGRLAGLRQIMGDAAQLKAEFKIEELPATVENVQFLDHVGSAQLFVTKPNYVIYREMSLGHLNTIIPSPAP